MAGLGCVKQNNLANFEILLLCVCASVRWAGLGWPQAGLTGLARLCVCMCVCVCVCVCVFARLARLAGLGWLGCLSWAGLGWLAGCLAGWLAGSLTG